MVRNFFESFRYDINKDICKIINVGQNQIKGQLKVNFKVILRSFHLINNLGITPLFEFF